MACHLQNILTKQKSIKSIESISHVHEVSEVMRAKTRLGKEVDKFINIELENIKKQHQLWQSLIDEIKSNEMD
jgi:hypothetical protein